MLTGDFFEPLEELVGQEVAQHPEEDGQGSGGADEDFF